MILADVVASGTNPDAISLWSEFVSWLNASWLMASRTDSAAWAIAFTINTWAASIDNARIAVYESVHALFFSAKKRAEVAQWLEKADELTDPEGHKEFRSRVDRLQKYIDLKDEKFHEATKTTNMLAKRIMWFSAIASVLVIVFQWYYNFTLALLLPYPLFFIWNASCGVWARFWAWVMRKGVKSEFEKIKKRCNKSNNEPPPMDELRKKFDL